MVNYKDLGLVNTREMFAKAIKGGYAIPAFNQLSFKYQKVPVITQTKHYFAIWQKEL